MTLAETETPALSETAPVGPAQSKMSPTHPPAPGTGIVSPPARQEIQPPIPVAVEIGLLVLAVLAGAAALFVRWQADRKFKGK